MRVPAIVALCVGYVAAGWLGLQAASQAHVITLFWLPSGLAVGAAVRFGPRALVGVSLASLTLNLLISRVPAFSLAVAFGNTLEAAVAAALFARWVPTRALEDSTAALRFCASLVLGCAVASVLGALATRTFLHVDAPVLELAHPWFLGDLAGAVLVAPWVIGAPRSASPVEGRGFPTPGCFAATSLVVVGLLSPLPRGSETFVALSIAIPVLLCGFRAGLRAAHGAALAVSIAAYAGALLGTGPFAAMGRQEAMLAVGACILATGGMALFASVLVGERNEALRDLVAVDERLRALFEHAPDGMLLLDERRRVLLANPAALRMAGAPLPEDAWRRLDGDSTQVLREALKRGVEKGDRIVEARMSYGEDEHGPREFVVRVALLGGAKDFRGAVVLVSDVTERERAVRDRTELEQHLAAAQRLESVGTLAGGIAHDFNNMLQAMQSNLELAQMALDRGRDPRDAVSRALDASERAKSLTRQLLAFSRRQPARYDRVDVLAVVRSSITMLERLLPEDIHLVFTPQVHSSIVRGDATQLEQVLVNLILNARDAMPGGGVLRIEVDAQRLPAPADAGIVRVVVTDEGPGVDPSIRDRIFEPFFTTKPTGKGTGLGLAVVYGIVKAHGGTIHSEPATPHGASFVVELPWLQGAEEATVSEVSGEAPIAGGQRVLLVEDDRLVRDSTREMLVEAGFVVTTAATGKEAVDAYRAAQGTIDVVLLDVVMPGIGGREAYEVLRAYDPRVAVVFATGYSDEQLDVGFVRREQVPVLTKPYSRSALVTALLEAVARRAAPGGGPA